MQKMQKVNVFRVDNKLQPENIGTIQAETKEELKLQFFRFLDKYLSNRDYIVYPDTTAIGIYAKRKNYNYYILD